MAVRVVAQHAGEALTPGDIAWIMLIFAPVFAVGIALIAVGLRRSRRRSYLSTPADYPSQYSPTGTRLACEESLRRSRARRRVGPADTGFWYDI